MPTVDPRTVRLNKDFRTSFEVKKGWWIEHRSTVPCILPQDGLLAVFRRQDIEEFMDKTYEHEVINGVKVWYFNETHDREIAELNSVEGRIECNPQVLIQHFLREKGLLKRVLTHGKRSEKS